MSRGSVPTQCGIISIKLDHIDGGVLMTDTVTYQPPFGFIGAIVNALIIKKRLQMIFDYRSGALEKRFGSINLT